MRAVGYFAPGPITAPDSLVDIELPRPSATGRDLLVEVRAVSVNPVDYKMRSSAAPPAGAAKVIGYDAAGDRTLEIDAYGTSLQRSTT